MSKKNNFYIIINFFFIFKWVFSYFLYNEDILTKIIFESKLTVDGAYYFPFIKFISEFDLNNSFTSSVNNLRNLTIPYGTILIQSILLRNIRHFVLILFLGSMNLLFLSILSEYIFKILEESKERPQYIIKKIINNNKI